MYESDDHDAEKLLFVMNIDRQTGYAHFYYCVDPTQQMDKMTTTELNLGWREVSWQGLKEA